MTRDPARRWSIDAAQQFLEAGPGATTATVPAGGLADIGLGGTARTRSYDDRPDAQGTQVLPVAAGRRAPPRTPTSPTPAVGPAGPARGAADGWSRLGAALAVVIAMVIAFAIGLHGDDDDPGTTADSAGRHRARRPARRRPTTSPRRRA